MRKISVFTGTRAEYGLLRPLMDEIAADGDMTLQLIVSGSHLAREFGATEREILADGFTIDGRVEVLLSSDSPVSVCKSIGLGLISYGEVLERLQPDGVVVLGDRYETFAMATAAHVLGVPVCHLHGGETTQGAIDEAFRHAITKMGSLHFTSTEAYRKRVIQLGENPDTVYCVGAPGVETIRKIDLLSRERLEEELGFTFGEQTFLVTFHPVTLEYGSSEVQFRNLLEAMDVFPEARIIFTKANADADHGAINRMIDAYVAAGRGKAIAFASMGQRKFFSAMKVAAAVVGNSSSGIIEAPSLKVPTVNIGNRQKGRVRAASVIDCTPVKHDIVRALQRAVDPAFRAGLADLRNPYEKENTASRIKEILKRHDPASGTRKEFFDL